MRDGVTKTQAKRIQAVHHLYKIETRNNQEIIFILKGTWKEIPFADKRKAIIEESHFLGHFGIDTTVSRIIRELNYYWPKIKEDVAYFIDRCLVCQRFSNFKPLEHEAKALKITRIFERVAMDLASGFPLSNSGYSRILVIVEYMTKVVKIYPMKSKESIEVAENLWKWISNFSPPSFILSDQGKEFVNQVIDQLLNVIGTERRVTSAYMPRTDGQAEKANDTVVKVLKKHSETDTQNWDKWIPFVEYSFNTRTASSTNYSPFELLYGVKPNNFANFITIEDTDEDIFIRSRQLRELIEGTRPLAIQNIEKAQGRQKRNQNKRSNLSDELEPGTPVMLKVEGLKGKLEPHYRGRYFVLERTEHGNYKLKNAVGKELKTTYPISKLRPIIEDQDKPEESVEVEEILGKRKNNETNLIEYLVKWKEFDETHNEWLSEDKFDDVEIINEYNSRMHRVQEIEQTRPVEQPRRAGRRKRLDVSNSLLIILIFFYLIGLTVGDIFINETLPWLTVGDIFINETLPYCDTSMARAFDFDTNCKSRALEARNNFKNIIDDLRTENGYEYNQRIFKYYTLIKLRNKIQGVAYECKFETVEATLHTTFLNTHLPPVKNKYSEVLGNKYCEDLVQTQLCNGEKMICEKSGCTSIERKDYSEFYSWWHPVVVTDEKCAFVQREIIAENQNDTLFVGHPECTYEKSHCNLHDSTVIWNITNVFHECPYQMIEDALTFELVESDILLSKNHNLALQITTITKECNTNASIIHTTEGLHLIMRDVNLREKALTNFDYNKHKQVIYENLLILAENDKAKFDDIRIFKELNMRMCLNTLNIIQLNRHRNDQFFRIKDIEGNNLNLYSKSNQVFMPNCVMVSNFEVLTNLPYSNKEKCYLDIKIRIRVGNNSEIAFLTDQKIIRKTSLEISCYNYDYEKIITFKDKTMIHRQYNNSHTIIKYTNNSFKYEQLRLINNNLTLLNFKHYEGLIHTIDFLRFNEYGFSLGSENLFYKQIPSVKLIDDLQDTMDNIITY